jgi:hypothetical protein
MTTYIPGWVFHHVSEVFGREGDSHGHHQHRQTSREVPENTHRHCHCRRRLLLSWFVVVVMVCCCCHGLLLLSWFVVVVMVCCW